MKKKDIILFEKTIHEVKAIIKDLVDERKSYHRQIDKIFKRHDKKTNKMIKEAQQTVDDLYELYEDLSNEKGK
jgi:hypothetical protein